MNPASNTRNHYVNLELPKLKEQADQFLSFLAFFDGTVGHTEQIANAVKNAKAKIEVSKANYLTAIKNIDNHYQFSLKAQEIRRNQQGVRAVKERRIQLEKEIPLDWESAPREGLIQEIQKLDQLLQDEYAKLRTSAQIQHSELDCQQLKMKKEKNRNQAERDYYMQILDTEAEVDKALC